MCILLYYWANKMMTMIKGIPHNETVCPKSPSAHTDFDTEYGDAAITGIQALFTATR